APTQAQVLALLAELRRVQGTSLLFVSHDLASVRRLCDRVLVLYLGRMAELAPTRALFLAPQHPYTRELLASIAVPDPDIQPARLAQVRLGEPPSPLEVPQGCAFRTRCPQATSLCAERTPAWQQSAGDRWVACHHWRGPADDMLLK
ncbi:oligopeptide ABC transporter ATP-binding protein, partial [mine drainage metagenome]